MLVENQVNEGGATCRQAKCWIICRDRGGFSLGLSPWSSGSRRSFQRPPSSLNAVTRDAEPERRGQRLKFKCKRRKTIFIINRKCVFSRRAHGNGPETSKGGREWKAWPTPWSICRPQRAAPDHSSDRCRQLSLWLL